MDKVTIRQFEKKDVEFAHRMTTIEQWNVKRSDIERMYNFEPGGCFMAEVNNQQAGHAFAISYGRLGWIGLVIVGVEFRRKGLASLLTMKAKEYLLDHGGKTVRLDAVPKVSDLYRKLGFIDEFDSLRFMTTLKGTFQSDFHHVRPVRREAIAELSRFDAKYFGAPRTRVLEALFEEYPQFCYLSRKGSMINGYIMGQDLDKGFNLGPWVCDPDSLEVAEELFAACSAKLLPGVDVFAGVPSANWAAEKLFERLGFNKCSRSIRMRLGGNLKNECVYGIFAIGGAMKG